MAVKLDRGILIAIDGIDGAGKTTQAALLDDRLRAAGFETVRTKEPTKGRYGQRLRESATTGRLDPHAELDLFIRDRREHVEQVIEPALCAGKTVIVDRYYFSTAAYQGARGLNPEEIIDRNEAFAPIPDLFVILAIHVETAMRRIYDRGEGLDNHFEQRSELAKCAAIFQGINHASMLRIDGERLREDIHRDIVEALDRGPIFNRLCRKSYLTECEPELCTYRILGTCQYFLLGTLHSAPTSSPIVTTFLQANARRA